MCWGEKQYAVNNSGISDGKVGQSKTSIGQAEKPGGSKNEICTNVYNILFSRSHLSKKVSGNFNQIKGQERNSSSVFSIFMKNLLKYQNSQESTELAYYFKPIVFLIGLDGNRSLHWLPSLPSFSP